MQQNECRQPENPTEEEKQDGRWSVLVNVLVFSMNNVFCPASTEVYQRAVNYGCRNVQSILHQIGTKLQCLDAGCGLNIWRFNNFFPLV